MKTNEYRGDREAFSLAYSPTGSVDPIEQAPEADRNNRVFGVGNSPGRVVAPAIPGRGPFPLRTLMVCFTIWLIATQAMIFDQIKFDERAHLLEQTTRSLGGPQVVVPNEPPSSLPSGGRVQRL